MKIGIIGLGMVGEAVAYGLRRIGHEVFGYDKDPKKTTLAFNSILKTELVFVCVPTPTIDSKCNTDALWDVIPKLNSIGYKGLIVIKSTVPPGTTVRFQETFSGMHFAFCPEFLRERARFSDFVENHELCIAGVFDDDMRKLAYDTHLIKAAHGNLPKIFARMKPTEAELAKYFVNCFNAYRVNFANAFYDVCKHLDADYSVIKDAVTKRSGISPDYLTCNEQTREFGGACLPKDTEAFAEFVSQHGLLTKVFENIVEENNRVKSGMELIGQFVRAARQA